MVLTEEVGAVGAEAGGLARFVPIKECYIIVSLNWALSRYELNLYVSLSLFSSSIFLQPGKSPGAVGWTPTWVALLFRETSIWLHPRLEPMTQHVQKASLHFPVVKNKGLNTMILMIDVYRINSFLLLSLTWLTETDGSRRRRRCRIRRPETVTVSMSKYFAGWVRMRSFMNLGLLLKHLHGWKLKIFSTLNKEMLV